ncbi:phosphate/phosphite/phosphonate ABC transporter substrate-binding protein [Undibacterium luofuense]|uniref:Phosphate/phosphite/phosphonate ABC transporter substrate-binding protein n=1 Tax=Undibacterium luofuense TaxID=2828733 RepID=A0A941DN03_9BURK|nr:phosphate/phosphite/phosphonate ABC transporter substrate-binding protein [Undibacterium luofuense]MBR7782780.1 phosphate/phosphite/phosphonate ABC transporter substrate-binding protein [Undibacterium luofuense]
MSLSLSRRRWLALSTGVLSGLAFAETARPLVIGVIPYLSPSVLLNLFAPVRDHLQKALGRPVVMYTATDVPTYVRRCLNDEYDLLLSSAHFTRLVQRRSASIPLTRFRDSLYGMIYVAGQSGVQHISQLKGKRIALTDRTILVNLEMFRMLRKSNIPESDVQLRMSANMNSALLSVAHGEADAAMTAHFAIDQMPASQRSDFRSILQTDPLPNIHLSASPRISPGDRQKIQQAMMTLGDQANGLLFLQRSRFGGVELADEKILKTLDVYLADTLHYLGMQ